MSELDTLMPREPVRNTNGGDFFFGKNFKRSISRNSVSFAIFMPVHSWNLMRRL